MTPSARRLLFALIGFLSLYGAWWSLNAIPQWFPHSWGISILVCLSGASAAFYVSATINGSETGTVTNPHKSNFVRGILIAGIVPLIAIIAVYYILFLGLSGG